MVIRFLSPRAFERSVVVAMVCVCASLAACAPKPPAQPPLEEDLAAIARFNERYLQAINDEDIEALSELTTEGHILTPPSGRPIVGKAENDAVNGRSFAQYEVQERWMPDETQVGGDLAFQRGRYDLVTTPKAGGEPRAINGYFLRIYQRQPNGEWRMTRDMFNVDSSSSAAPAE